MSKAEFHDAPDASEVVKAVIEEVPEHGHLRIARIRCLLRTGEWMVRRRLRWASIRVLPAEIRHIANADIVLTVNATIWDKADEATRRALIDHELSHVSMNDEGNWTTVPHDVEDFLGVIRRRGLWRDDVRKLVQIAQEALPFGVEAA